MSIDPDHRERMEAEARARKPQLSMEFIWTPDLGTVTLKSTWTGAYPRGYPPKLTAEQIAKGDEVARFILKAGPGDLVCTQRGGVFTYSWPSKAGRTV